jgi:hypothetical protein
MPSADEPNRENHTSITGWALTIGAAVVLGLVSGLAWFSIGERLDDAPIGNFLAWWVFPAIPPFLISVAIFLLSRPRAVAFSRSVTFFGCYYAAHWTPMGVLLALLSLPGAHM